MTMKTIYDTTLCAANINSAHFHASHAKRYAVYAFQVIRGNGVRIPIHLSTPIELDNLDELRTKIRRSYKAHAVRLVYTENLFSAPDDGGGP